MRQGRLRAKIAHGAFFGVATFLMTDDHTRRTVETRQATHDRQVVGKVSIAVHFHKVGENFTDVIQGVGALGMTGNFGHLPGRQVRINVFGQLMALFAELVDFF